MCSSDLLAVHKYVFRGCIVGPDSPKTVVVCAKCGFIMYRGGTWQKAGTDVSVFGTAFSGVVAGFVRLFASAEAVHYEQSVRDGRLVMQRVQFRCARDRQSIEAAVDRLMQEYGVRRAESRYGHEVFIGSDPQSVQHKVWLLTDRGEQLLDLAVYPERQAGPAREGKVKGQQPAGADPARGGPVQP